MWKAFLPREVALTLKPTFDPETQQLRCAYQINGMPLLEWIGRQVVKVIGNVNIEHIKVTSDDIILRIPTQDLPYKIVNITVRDITILLKIMSKDMFLLNPWTFGSIVKIAQLVLSGVIVAKEFVEMARDKDEHDD